MVTRLDWDPAYHIIPSRFPTVGIFDEVADPEDLEVVIALAAATNPRVMDEAGELPLVRPRDRISGPGTAPVMAAFTHAKPSRFSDGTFGVYYAGHDLKTAIAETAYHRGRFLREAGFPDERLDMRVYSVAVTGSYEDLRALPAEDPLYDPDSYALSQAFGKALYERERDGVVFRSVRRPEGECVAAFRPRAIARWSVSTHLEYRFRDYRLERVVEIRERAE